MTHRFLTTILILGCGLIAGMLFFVLQSYPLVLPSRAEVIAPSVEEPLVDAGAPRLLTTTRARIGPRLREGSVPVPAITAAHAVIVDGETGALLYAKGERVATPIASLTKLMTALVTLDQNFVPERRVVMERSDYRTGSALFVRTGEALTAQDLLFTSLIGSANNATVALARSTGLDLDVFIEEMNRFARRIGMLDTTFVEPTGLDPKNTSTALDIARLAQYAFQNEMIRRAVTTEEYIFRALHTRERHRIQTTDKLLRVNGRSYTIIGGKTGFINEAGFCLVIEAERDGHRVIALVLGSESETDRFRDVDALIEWAFESYQWDHNSQNM